MLSGVKYRLIFFIILFLSTSIVLFFLFKDNSLSTAKEKYLTVVFLDVGQGDSIFIETPDGVQMLIDGGPDNSVLRSLAKQMPVGDRDLDVVLATHSDKDHVGGLVDVLSRYEVEHVVTTNNKNDTTVAEAFVTQSLQENSANHTANFGQQLALGASTSLLILSPAGDVTGWESNTASIVAQLRYGDIEFMLTGDVPSSIEGYLVGTQGKNLASEVLKLGHHGSRTSSSGEFLDAVQPKYAIVSAGKDNSYGHPHREVVERVQTRNVKMLNTAEEGSIVFKSDGKRVWMVQ